MNFARQSAFLFWTALLLLTALRWQPALSTVASFGIYGALHALAVAWSLEQPATPLRKVAFVSIAALLSMLGVSCVLLIQGLSPTHRWSGIVIEGTLISCTEAAAYSVLIRLFWLSELSSSSVGWIAACCGLVTWVMLEVRTIPMSSLRLSLAISWWCAYSASLWYRNRRRSSRLLE